MQRPRCGTNEASRWEWLERKLSRVGWPPLGASVRGHARLGVPAGGAVGGRICSCHALAHGHLGPAARNTAGKCSYDQAIRGELMEPAANVHFAGNRSLQRPLVSAIRTRRGFIPGRCQRLRPGAGFLPLSFFPGASEKIGRYSAAVLFIACRRRWRVRSPELARQILSRIPAGGFFCAELFWRGGRAGPRARLSKRRLREYGPLLGGCFVQGLTGYYPDSTCSITSLLYKNKLAGFSRRESSDFTYSTPHRMPWRCLQGTPFSRYTPPVC